MQLPSVDVFIGLIFAFGIAYSFLLQRDKTITTLCSVYIGLVIASNFSQTIFEFFNGSKVIANQIWIRGNASTSTIAIVLFIASIIMISGAINSKSKKSEESSMFEILLYSAFTMALILSSVLSFLPEETRNHYLEVSKAAKYLFNWKTLFVVTPPIVLIVMNWRKGSK